MDPVTIAASIAAVKTAIGAAKNIQSIGHSLDGLFKAQEEHKKKKQKAKPSTRMQQVLRMRAGDEGYDDDTSISAVANQVLEEKKTQAAIASLAKEIDRKWGRGTWDQILQQRKKLLAERAAADQLAKENALRKAKADKIFWHKVLVETGKVVLVLLFAGAMVGFVMWAATAPKIR
tara:strand:+ start:938 stop:1465 length:528 start_codon:yes stop_codon:yes gene_type:complete